MKDKKAVADWRISKRRDTEAQSFNFLCVFVSLCSYSSSSSPLSSGIIGKPFHSTKMAGSPL